MGTSKWGKGGSSTLAQRAAIQTRFEHQLAEGTLVDHGEVFLPDFTERVRAGMDMLDKVCPGWQNEIDTEKLDLESDENCVLGQTWPLYAKAHGLLELAESGDYKEFSDSVLSPLMDFTEGDETKRRNLAAALVGFALSEEDFEILNHQGRWDGLISISLVPRFWEALTITWLTEISKAKLEGRWEPYTADVLDGDIAKTKEASGTETGRQQEVKA